MIKRWWWKEEDENRRKTFAWVHFCETDWWPKHIKVNSATRRLDYLFNIFLLTTLKNCPKALQICQSSYTFCQIPNKPLRTGQRLLTFCQGGEILPNLVPLICSGKVVLAVLSLLKQHICDSSSVFCTYLFKTCFYPLSHQYVKDNPIE